MPTMGRSRVSSSSEHSELPRVESTLTPEATKPTLISLYSVCACVCVCVWEGGGGGGGGEGGWCV